MDFLVRMVQNRSISLQLHDNIRGELVDVYKEFMISENVSVSKEALAEDFNAHYWEGRYTLRNKHIPNLLKLHAQKILIAGKYLTVVRGCADFDQSESIRQSDASIVDCQFDSDVSGIISKCIDDAYVLSSRTLLRLLEVKYSLTDHLRSLRRFFFLEHGDFFIQFMDVAEEELRKEVKDVSLPRVQVKVVALILYSSEISFRLYCNWQFKHQRLPMTKEKMISAVHLNRTI